MKKLIKKHDIYIDGQPKTHGNIARFINSCMSSLFHVNCSFEKHSNDKEFRIKRKASIVVVHTMHSLFPSDEWLINYNFRRPPISYEKHIALGLLLDVPLGRNKNFNA